MFGPRPELTAQMRKSFFAQKDKIALWVLSLVALATRFPLAFRSVKQLTLLPYGDDAYYLFTIARNLAKGLGPSVDGHHLTNGFQPLLTFLYVPLFLIAGDDKWLAVRLSFILAGVIAAISVWMVAYVIRSLNRTEEPTSAPINGALLWTLSFQIFSETTNGLETGLYSLLLLITIALYTRMRQDDNSNSKLTILLGVTLGLTVLTRIDAAILVVVLFIAEVLKQKWKPALTFTAIAVFISSPWWIYNAVYFGSLMPTSGQAENIWPLPEGENLKRALQALTDIVPVIFYAPDSLSILFRLALALIFAVGIILATRNTRLRESLRAFRASCLIPFFIFGIALVVYYTFFFRAPHFIARYLQPLRIAWLLLIAISLPSVYALLKKRWKRLALPLVVVILLLVLCFDISRYATNYVRASNTEFYDAGKFAASNYSVKIGMLQSGIASFVSANVINLDGKVNTDALRAHQDGRLAQYLRDEKFTYIADLKPFIEDVATMARQDELFFDSVGMIGRIQIMKLRDASPRLRN